MTEYDYSPEAWEAHLAKQASIAEWSARTSSNDSFPNPFKPTEEDIERLKASGFYNQDRKRYTGPDRPPSPGVPPTPPQGGYQYPLNSPPTSGSTTASVVYASGQEPVVIPPGHTAHIPIWNPATRQYDWHKFTNPSKSRSRSSSKGPHSRSGGSTKSGSTFRPQPTRSATMPAYPVQQQPAQQQSAQYVHPPHPQQTPNSGSTVASQKSGSMGYASYPNVIVDGATPRKSNKLHKAKES